MNRIGLKDAIEKLFEFEVVKLDDRGDISSRETETASYFIEPLGPGVKPLEGICVPCGDDDFVSFFCEDPPNPLNKGEPEF